MTVLGTPADVVRDAAATRPVGMVYEVSATLGDAEATVKAASLKEACEMLSRLNGWKPGEADASETQKDELERGSNAAWARRFVRLTKGLWEEAHGFLVVADG